ncbi:hypothetical protein Tco_1547720 [Tanacetum coccineum]
MRTCSQSRNLNRQQQVNPAFVEPFNLEEPIENPAPPVVTMDDNRTMAQLLEAPTEGYRGCTSLVPGIHRGNFESSTFAIPCSNKAIFGHDKKDPLCSHQLHQLDTFYNALNSNDQDSLYSHGGELRAFYPGIFPMLETKEYVKALLLDRNPKLHSVKASGKLCYCGGAHSYRIVPPPMATFIVTIFKSTSLKPPQPTTTKEIPATELRLLIKFDLPVFLPPKSKLEKSNDQFNGHAFQIRECQYHFIFGYGLPSNTVTNPKEDLKGITTRSGVAYRGPTIPTTSSSPKVVERETEVTKDTMLPTNNGSTKDVQPPVV